nr:helix-turn-helix transcriptional regulator [uncultured Chryseobacterium sp.]
MEHQIHQGRNIKRFREMLGIKQEALAFDLGDEWNQKKISLLEQKDVIDDLLLNKISKALKIPAEAFKNFDEEQAVSLIANSFSDFKDSSSAVNIKPVFNPIEAVLQLHEDKIELYERMLKEKDDMMARLEKMLQDK